MNGFMTDNGMPNHRPLPRSLPLGAWIERIMAERKGQLIRDGSTKVLGSVGSYRGHATTIACEFVMHIAKD